MRLFVYYASLSLIAFIEVIAGKNTVGWCRICGKRYEHDHVQRHLRNYGIHDHYMWYYYNEIEMEDPGKAKEIQEISVLNARGKINVEQRLAELKARGEMKQSNDHSIDLDKPKDRGTIGWCRICGKKYASIQQHLKKKYGIRGNYRRYYYNKKEMEVSEKSLEIRSIASIKNRRKISVKQRIAELRGNFVEQPNENANNHSIDQNQSKQHTTM